MANTLIKTITIDNVGEVKLCVSRIAKRVSLNINRKCEVRLTIPTYASVDYAIAFVRNNAEWINEKCNKIREQQKLQPNSTDIFSETSVFKTRTFQLKIERGRQTVRSFSAVLSGGILRVTCPPSVDIASDRAQHAIRMFIERALRCEAKLLLPKRLNELAKINGFSYNSCAIKMQKSRWGSCSSKGNINLNLHLVRLPQHLIDLVLLHELCHTVEMNHGAKFWLLLNKVTQGRAKELTAEMKKWSPLVLKCTPF